MRRLNSFVLLAMLALPLCVPPAYRIDIVPRLDDDTVEIQVNAPAVFTAIGYEKKEDQDVEVEVPVERVWWNFDKGTLSKANSGSSSITIQAAKEGSSKLTVVGMVRNNSCTRTITVLVKKADQ
ncbi:MAG: hypothetical protein PHV48_04565 [Candidatus Omnitrophica bacterium]|nr:hypothetical protein [Candidatus Omnitrophota bacterium]